MDSLPATVPAVTASPGDPELLGPLSVLYAALIAKLLEVTVPSPREGLRLWKWGGPGPGRASVQSDMTVPGEASGVRGRRDAALRCGTLWSLAEFSELCHSDRQSVYRWNPFLGTVSGGGANIIISRQ